DALIRRWVDQQLEARNPELLQFLRREAPIGIRVQLDDSIRRAKELLSDTPSATITVAGGGFHETLQLTRDEFEELITPPLTVARQLTQATLADAGIRGPGDLAALYLTGGTSRIPLVHDTLAPLGPVATLDDPKTVVAQGALATWMAANPEPATSQAPYMPDLAGGRDTTTRPLGGTIAPPGWAAAPDPNPPTQATDTKSRRTPLLIGGAVVAVGIVAAVAAFAFSSGDGPSTPAAAPSSSAPPVTLSSSQDQVLAALPEQLRKDLQNCQQGSYSGSFYNAYTVKCVLRVDSPLLEGINDTSNDVSVSAYIDERTAQRNLASYKTMTNGGGIEYTYVPTADANAGVQLTHFTSSGSPNGQASYANKATFLNVDVTNFQSNDNAQAFMKRAGLLQ
ncbi:MAG: Hsp70 family protein, partial [Gordonia polyisoprenivorans]|nr:Hsp70 family protein [Gordonia polyisoprenivorans]